MNHFDGIFAYKCSTFILNIKCKSFKSNLIKNQREFLMSYGVYISNVLYILKSNEKGI